MIDPLAEELVALADVPRLLPKRRGGRKVHVATVYRWVQRGLKGIRLETLQVGGTKCTSHEALSRFLHRLTEGPEAETARLTPAQRRRQDDRDEAELEAMGIR